MRKLCSVGFAILLLFTFSFSANAFTETVPYVSYTYSADGSIIESPQAYLPETVIYGHTLGIADFTAATDIDCDKDGNLYVLDEEANQVIILNPDLTLNRVLNVKQTISDGTEISLLDAKGITVTNDRVYICDTENSRVLVLDVNDGKYINMITTPKSRALTEDFIFKPAKVAVDEEENYYIVGQGTYEGIINISAGGEFLGFFAKNKATASAWQLFWRRFSTIEQRKKSIQFVPQDLSSIDMDKSGFFLITIATKQDDSMIKRTNPGGKDVIRNLSAHGLIGDIKGDSSFIDTSSGEHKIYACLDSKAGRIFCYNTDGYLLYTFGCLADQLGGFTVPSAITYLGDDRIAVLDSKKNSITVFAATEYAKAINEGLRLNNDLLYDEAVIQWREVLKYNQNFEFAQTMIANSLHTSGEYEDAMHYFKQSHNKSMYSTAKKAMRTEWINDNLKYIVIIVLILIVLFYVWKVIKTKRKTKTRGGDII